MKRTVRNKVFETNSSTNHTLVLYKGRKDNIPQIESIGLLSRDEFYEEHTGFKDKFAFLLTECMFIEYDNPRKYFEFLTELLKDVNEKYNTNIKFDLSRMADADFYFNWKEYSDGCDEHFVYISGIQDDQHNDKTIEETITENVMKHNDTFPNEGVWFDMYDVDELLTNKDGFFEILTNANLSINTTR